jgi:ADP-heptose:LPS heptosyltransferase
MKILLISLLRLGDIILHRQVVQNLKRQYPGAQIHMLIHSQFQSVQGLLPEVDQWHLLDRQEIQKILVERQVSPVQAFAKLQTVVAELNGQNFSLAFNLTHNRFSVRLMDLVQAREKRGVALEHGKKVADINPWQTYLNENFSDRQGSRFHYLEVLQRSLGIAVGSRERAEKRTSPLILLQLLTSDVKKNWGLHRFHELKTKLQTQFPKARILGLCSPQEASAVGTQFAWNEFLTPSLDEAALLLKEASLLVTGDTSIQHLAAQNGCPVVSLFLGSADPVKTAPWQEGAWVVQGQAACAPCVHSAPCHQSRHLCAESLQVETVFNLVAGILSGEKVKVTGSEVRQTTTRGESVMLKAATPNLLQELEHETWWQYLHGTAAAELPVGDALEWQSLAGRHAQFQSQVAAVKAGHGGVSELEENFPEWKDSLIRWQRDPQFTQEVDELGHIRHQILNQILDQIMENTEKENVRYTVERSQSPSQERLAEA